MVYFIGYLVYYFPVLVCCTKKNLAILGHAMENTQSLQPFFALTTFEKTNRSGLNFVSREKIEIKVLQENATFVHSGSFCCE
jgi:hypothetical protein